MDEFYLLRKYFNEIEYYLVLNFILGDIVYVIVEELLVVVVYYDLDF